MGIKKALTDSIRRLAGNEKVSRPSPEIHAAMEAAELWREEMSRWDAEELAAQQRPLQARSAELGRRLDSLGDELPKMQLVRELIANARELATARFERERARSSQISEGTRTVRRTAQQHELKHHHLHDELERCRDLIAQECRRRGLRLPTEAEGSETDLHERLYQLLKAISHVGSQRMQVAMTDPVLAELELLLTNEDPTASERFPEWLKKPAARLLAVVQERNRYKRLLKNSGLLPADG